MNSRSSSMVILLLMDSFWRVTLAALIGTIGELALASVPTSRTPLYSSTYRELVKASGTSVTDDAFNLNNAWCVSCAGPGRVGS